MDNRGATVQSLLRSLMLLGHRSRGGQCAMLNSKRVLPLETPRTKDVYYSLIILRRESHVLFIILRKTKCLGRLGYRCSLRCVQRFWLIARNPKRTLASHGALSSVDHRHAATIISRASGAAGPQPSQLSKPKPPLSRQDHPPCRTTLSSPHPLRGSCVSRGRGHTDV